jgi:hypothetical protein
MDCVFYLYADTLVHKTIKVYGVSQDFHLPYIFPFVPTPCVTY